MQCMEIELLVVRMRTIQAYSEKIAEGGSRRAVFVFSSANQTLATEEGSQLRKIVAPCVPLACWLRSEDLRQLGDSACAWSLVVTTTVTAMFNLTRFKKYSMAHSAMRRPEMFRGFSTVREFWRSDVERSTTAFVSEAEFMDKIE